MQEACHNRRWRLRKDLSSLRLHLGIFPNPLRPNGLRKLCNRLPGRWKKRSAGAMGYRRSRRLRKASTTCLFKSTRPFDRLFRGQPGLTGECTAQMGGGSERTMSRYPHHTRRPEEGPTRRPACRGGDEEEEPEVRFGERRREHGSDLWSQEVLGMLELDWRGC